MQAAQLSVSFETMAKVFTKIQRRIIFTLVILSIPTVAYLSLKFSSIDSVVSQYGSYKDAEENSVFLRGWLPQIIPKSSFNIYVENNLDLNSSIGEFSFNPSEVRLFLKQLVFHKNVGSKYKIYTYTSEHSVWEFKIDTQLGHVEYILKPKQS